MNKKHRKFNLATLEKKMPNVKHTTYQKYLTFLTELPEWLSIDRGMSLGDHCKSEPVSSNAYIVMQAEPISLLTRKKFPGKMRFQYYLNYEISDNDFKKKARMLAVAWSLYGQKGDDIWLEEGEEQLEPTKPITLSTSQAPEELADNAGQILTKFGKEEKHIEFEHEPTPEKVSTVADKGTKGWQLKDTPEQLKQSVEQEPVKPKKKVSSLANLEKQLGLAVKKMAEFGDNFDDSQKTIHGILQQISEGLKSEEVVPVDDNKGLTLHIGTINIFYNK